MDVVQTPIIPVIGRMIRSVPGTISLGQGWSTTARRRSRGRRPRGPLAVFHARIQRRAGIPPLLERISRKLAVENGIDVARGSRIMVTAGANMAFMQRGAGHDLAGR